MQPRPPADGIVSLPLHASQQRSVDCLARSMSIFSGLLLACVRSRWVQERERNRRMRYLMGTASRDTVAIPQEADMVSLFRGTTRVRASVSHPVVHSANDMVKLATSRHNGNGFEQIHAYLYAPRVHALRHQTTVSTLGVESLPTRP